MGITGVGLKRLSVAVEVRGKGPLAISLESYLSIAPPTGKIRDIKT